MVLKQCPKCEKQIPVACKTCPCGHIYNRSARDRCQFEQLTTSVDPSSSNDPGNGSGSTTSSHVDIDEFGNEYGVANAVKRRRTERILRARQARQLANDRLIAAELNDRQIRRRSRRVVTSISDPVDQCEVISAPKRRGRRKSTNVGNGKNEDDDRLDYNEDYRPRESLTDTVDKQTDVFANVTPQASMRYSIILDEINRKLVSNNNYFNF